MSLYEACREYVSARDCRNWANEELADDMYVEFMETVCEREARARAAIRYHLDKMIS